MFVVFDLDGTLADIGHRLHHIRDGRRNYTAFFADCPFDLLNVPVALALHAHLMAGHKVEIWSARSAVVETETRAWLANYGINPALLTHMRPADDSTEDAKLKRAWLLAIHPDDRPDCIYDDRQRVVDMWRDEGVACFQVTANWEVDSRTVMPIVDPLLTIMVGPSGGGKSEWVSRNVPADEVISSDALRLLYTGTEGDQSRNDDVFYALHKLAKARLECGLPVTIDATNLRRKDRVACVALASAGVGVRYVVVDRPLADKHATAGRRTNVVMRDGKSLIDAHHERFYSQMKDILAGDGLPQVTVVDARDLHVKESAEPWRIAA